MNFEESALGPLGIMFSILLGGALGWWTATIEERRESRKMASIARSIGGSGTMKTATLRVCLATLKASKVDGVTDPYPQLRANAEAEIEAVETENATLRAALKEVREWIGGWSPVSADGGWGVIGDRIATALSSAPTEKVMVSLDELREIEWLEDWDFIEPDGGGECKMTPVERFCPACGGRKNAGHSATCWLGNIMCEEA